VRRTIGSGGGTVAGLDGCRGGWVVAAVPRQGRGPSSVHVVPDLRTVVAAVEDGRLAAVAVDIPIGLPLEGSRAADVLARARLGPRRSSVFPAPVRAVLGAADYEEACTRSRAVCGKGISKQLFNILPKIAQADDVLSPSLQEHVVEMCPELSFTVLTGTPMAHAKSTPAGRMERRDALTRVFDDTAGYAACPPSGARADDVLDAFAGAWTARRFARGAHVRLGGELDARGLRMEVIA
jgi:predicted RNase H-like nuclease